MGQWRVRIECLYAPGMRVNVPQLGPKEVHLDFGPVAIGAQVRGTSGGEVKPGTPVVKGDQVHGEVKAGPKGEGGPKFRAVLIGDGNALWEMIPQADSKPVKVGGGAGSPDPKRTSAEQQKKGAAVGDEVIRMVAKWAPDAPPGPGNAIVLTRAAYKVSKERVETVSKLLKELLVKDEVFEAKYEGGLLTITTTPPLQAKVAHVIEAIQDGPTPKPGMPGMPPVIEMRIAPPGKPVPPAAPGGSAPPGK